MQAESTSSVRMVRWFGALGVVLAPFALASGCAAGEVPTEEAATAEQAATLCTCVNEDLCGRDTCTSRTGTGLCTTLCRRPEVKCYVKADETGCTTSGGLKGECTAGICISPDCAGCVIPVKDECVEGTSESACGSGGAECEDCDDGNPCTTDRCVTLTKLGPRYCSHVASPEGTSCTNGTCVGTSCCTGCVDEGGACHPGTSPSACGLGGKDCSICTDEDACNGTETCDASGACQPGEPLRCEDDDPCTTVNCDASTGCMDAEPNTGEACSDGDPCTTGDTCSDAGVCESGPGVSCDDAQPCTTDSCDTTTGECLHEPLADDETCDDGNNCTDDDICTDGKCGGEGMTCPDPGPCRRATCDSNVCDVTHVAADTPCLSDPCLVGQTCDGDGECAGGAEKDCSDNNPCTEDTCEAGTGKCVNEPVSSTPSDGCSDGNPCTTEDACNDDGECEGTDVTCTPIDCMSADACNESTGLCSYSLESNGSECPGGTCVSGRCEISAAAGAGGVDGGAGGADVAPPQGGDNGSAEGGSPNVPAAGAPSQGGSEDGSDSGKPDGGDSSEQAGASSEGEDAGAGGSQSTDDDEEAGSPGQPGTQFRRDPGGCDCRTSADEPSTGWLAVALGLVALGRRRARYRYPS